MRRLVGVVALGALVIGLVGVQGAGAGLGSGGDDDHPVGYTVGGLFNGRPAFCNFYKVDLTTAEATRVNPPGVGVECADGLTFDDDGTLYAYRNTVVFGTPQAELVTIDLDDGRQHLVGLLPRVPVGGGGMTFDADGDLWLYGIGLGEIPCPGSASCLWEIDPDTAEFRFVGEAPAGRAVYGLTADCEDVIGISAVAPSGADGFAVRLDEVNTSNAALETIVGLPGFGFPSGLDFEDDGDLWAIGASGAGGAGIGATLWRINPSEGTFQTKDITLGGAPFTEIVNGLAVDPIECDEPPTTTTTTPAPPTPVAVAPVFTG
jgi:hypothetical protein